MARSARQVLAESRKTALLVGGIATILAAGALLLAPRGVAFGWLTAFVLLAGFPIGSGMMLALSHVGGGRWTHGVRAPLVAAARTLGLLAILLVPVFLLRAQLYPWAGDTAERAMLPPQQQAYLSTGLFVGRAVLFFFLWWGCARLLCSRYESAQASESGPTSAAPAIGAAGLLMYVMTVSFVGIDWIAALEARWYSSIVGLHLVVTFALTAWAWVVAVRASALGNDIDASQRDELHDQGNMLLLLVVLDAYLAFSQYLIIWTGNLPHEIAWFEPRTRGFWGGVGTAMILLHFALPFALLLSRDLKRRAAALTRIAALVLVAQFISVLWMVAPSFGGPAWIVVVTASVAVVGAGGLWIGLFSYHWQRLEEAAAEQAPA